MVFMEGVKEYVAKSEVIGYYGLVLKVNSGVYLDEKVSD